MRACTSPASFHQRACSASGARTAAASARALAAEGCRVAISSSDEQRIEAAAKTLRDEGFDVVARVADVREPDQCRNLVEWAVATLGGLEVLINNTRGPVLGTVAEISSWAFLAPALAIFTPLFDARGVALALTVSAALSFGVLLALVSGRWTWHDLRPGGVLPARGPE